MDHNSEKRLAEVYPRLADKVRAMAEQLATEGINIIVVQGLRTVEQQDALYAQGRTTPGAKVTNAKGGLSYHNFGLAVDCAPLDGPSHIDWSASHPNWLRMEKVGVDVGLVSGASWRTLPDAPHFQLQGPSFPEGAPNDELRAIYDQGGLQAVWNAVEASLTK